MKSLRTPWRAVAAIFVLNGSLLGVWAARIPAVADRHDLSHGALGLLLLLLAAGAICTFPIAGRAADRFGAYPVTMAVTLAYLPSLVLISLAPNVLLLAVALALFGAIHGAMDVVMNAWASEVERAAGKPQMSSFHGMFSLGAGVGAGSAALALSYGLGLELHFLLSTILFAGLCLPFALIDWTSEKRLSKGPKPPVFAIPRGALLIVGVVAACSSIGEGAMIDWSAIFLVEGLGTPERLAPIGYAVFSMAMLTVRLAGDKIIAALGPVLAARIAGAAAATGVATAVFGGSFETALAGFLLMGMGYALVMPLAFSRAANDPDLSPGAALAAVSTFGYGGLLAGPPIIGFLAEAFGLRWAFLILGGLAATIVVLAPVLRRQG